MRRTFPMAALLGLAAGLGSTAAFSSERRASPTTTEEFPAADFKPPRAVRFQENPIIRPEMLPGRDGDNINGPSLIAVPSWVPKPLGKYYLYFAHHGGKYIRMAYADELRGPWHIHKPGVLRLEDTVGHGHIASPDVLIDEQGKKIRLYFHVGGVPGEKRGQVTLLATSDNGLDFTASREVLGAFYFRVFRYGGFHYALDRWGRLLRSQDGLRGFEPGPAVVPGDGAASVRHVAVRPVGDTAEIYYSRVGDAPERIVLSRMDLRGDWKTWRATRSVEVLAPETKYEGVDLPLEPSRGGAGKGRQLRDPAVFEEAGKTYLLYSVAGESGIGIAELTAAAASSPKAAASQPKTGEAAASQPGGSSRERILAVMRKVNAQEAARKSADRNWIGGTYYTGVMALYRASEEPAVLEQAVAWAEKNQWEPGTEGQYSANSLTCGQTYLELYFLKRDETRIAKIRAFVDAQVEAAMKQKKSAGWGYIDTLYVGPPTIAMLGELSGERKYYDFLDKMFWATAESLLDKETGLFYRDRGYIGKQTERGKKILWSRGNGWAIAGTARVLQHMPKEHPTRARYVELLRTLAASLAKVQGEDGLWRSNLADAEQFPNPETSGSAFFCYAMAWGVNQGLLDKATYLPVIARTWRGLVACVQPDGRLGFAQAVGAAPAAAGPKSAFPYATGLFLLAGGEVLKLAEELDQAGTAK
jgi:unsaturated rhamnogalacturonyl hydrolase